MKAEQFIDFMKQEAKRHLLQEGAEIGDKIAWGYISNLINSYKTNREEK